MTYRLLACMAAGLLVAVSTSSARADIYGAVLPSSRAVQVNQTVTAFATILNANASQATSCGLNAPANFQGTFSFQTTDPNTNQLTGTPNTRVSISVGGAQTYVFAMKPTSAFAQTEFQIGMSCTGSSVAAISGVNTFLLTSSATQTPDVVTIAATVANDGVARTPGTTATGVFTVAAINIGVGSALTVNVDTGNQTLNANFVLCRTDAQAQCQQPPAASVQTNLANNEIGFFSVFVTSQGTVIPLDPAHARAFVRFKVSTSTVGATSVAVQTQITLGVGGGSLQLGQVNVQAPTGATVVPADFSATPAADPAPVPGGTASFNRSFNIGVSNNAGLFNNGLNAPVVVTIPYSGLGISDPSTLQVLHFDSATGQYAPTTLQNIDRTAQTISFDSRAFSLFTLVTYTGAIPPQFFVTSGGVPFAPGTNGFAFNNKNSAFLTPDGSCFGMSAFAAWFWRYRSTQTLSSHYSATSPSPYSIQQLVAMRAQLTQATLADKIYDKRDFLFFGSLATYQINHPNETLDLLKHDLSVFNDPVVVAIGNATDGLGHAILAFGYDANNIYFYDPNCPANNCSFAPNGVVVVPYTAAGIGQYPLLLTDGVPQNQYATINHLSFGGGDSFNQIAMEADGGFAASANLSVTSPQQNSTVSDRSVHLTGSLGGNLNQASEVAYWNNGPDPATAAVAGGSFDQVIDVACDKNTLLVIAGVKQFSGQLDNTLANAAVVARQFTGPSDCAKLRATLTWLQNNTDVDLYVTEPGAGGETAWYSNPTTAHGLRLDFDNTSGRGPENTTLPGTTTPIAGNYTVKVHYYSDHSTGQSVNGSVVIRLYEPNTNHPAPKYKEKTVNWQIGVSKPANSAPGSSGADWFTIGTADVAGDNIP